MKNRERGCSLKPPKREKSLKLTGLEMKRFSHQRNGDTVSVGKRTIKIFGIKQVDDGPVFAILFHRLGRSRMAAPFATNTGHPS